MYHHTSIITTTRVAAFAMLSITTPSQAVCTCDGDADGNGAVNAIDVDIVRSCVEGNCANCTNANGCDVNCDGTVDYIDFGVALCQSQGNLNCCDEPDGACTDVTGFTGLPACITTLEIICTGTAAGTFHGPNTACAGDQVIDIPATSQWGLLGLALLVLIGGTILLGHGKTKHA